MLTRLKKLKKKKYKDSWSHIDKIRVQEPCLLYTGFDPASMDYVDNINKFGLFVMIHLALRIQNLLKP